MIKIIITMLGLIGGGLFTFLKFRRGSLNDKDSLSDLNAEDILNETQLDADETEEVLEATYEILEGEIDQDETFENRVTKIREEIHLMDDDYLAEYINGFFATESTDYPIACTDDQSKFEWERQGS